MLVRWDCGCVGLIVNDECWIFETCDNTGPEEFLLFKRDMQVPARRYMTETERRDATAEQKCSRVPRQYTALDAKTEAEFISRVNKAFADACSFNAIGQLASSLIERLSPNQKNTEQA